VRHNADVVPHRDPLTGLPTLSWPRDEWSDFYSSVPKFDTIIYFDVDTLSCVNDLYGRDEADNRLRSVANAIRESIPAEYPVLRFSGDEFLALVSSSRFGESELKALQGRLVDRSLRIEADYTNVDHFSVSCVMANVSNLASREELGRMVDEMADVIRAAKDPLINRKYRRQNVLVLHGAA